MSVHRAIAALCALCATTSVAHGATFFFSHGSGLGAEAEFTLVNATTIEIRLRNISTGVPVGFSNSDQILTSISFDMGMPGQNVGDPTITAGSVVVGASSNSVNFSTGAFGPGADVTGEWGYGNIGATGLLPNVLSVNTSHVDPFGGENRDGPAELAGPQGGLVASPPLIAPGGQGVIEDEVVATLTISQAIANLDFLLDNGMIVEFGSDAAFIFLPTPGAAVLFVIGLMAVWRRRATCGLTRG